MLRSALALIMVAMPVSAAQVNGSAPAIDLPQADSPDDVIVMGLRIPREKLPTAVLWNYDSMLEYRIKRENSEMFLRCALRSTDVRWLRQVVDGEPNSATARFAQGRIIESHDGCYPPIRSTGIMAYNKPVSTVDYGNSFLDRGVIIEKVLQAYAPDVALTPEITSDPVVKNRFRWREGVRNRLRLPNDRDALVFASCLVEGQPVLATRLLRSKPGSQLERGLTQAILVQGRACIGAASRVNIEPTLTRIYIADAFYRWVVAARGVGSLIPPEAGAG